MSAKELWRKLGFKVYLMKLVLFLKQLVSKHKNLSVAAGTVLVISLTLYFYAIQPILLLYGKSQTLPRSLRPIMAAINRKDIKTLDFELKYFRREVLEIKNSADRIGIFRRLPLIGPYAADLKNGAAAALEGYDTAIQMASFLEPFFPNITFGGWQSSPSTNSKELKFSDLARALPSFSTEFNKYRSSLESISGKLMTIDENRYPEYFRTRPIRKYLSQMRSLSAFVNRYLDELAETLSLVPDLVGLGNQKNYLVIIQNDKEIRPGGGLLGGYAFLALENGDFKLTKSGDISFLDRNVAGARPAAPDYLSRFLGERYLYIKDANYFPDFAKSANLIRDLWLATPQSSDLESIVAVDTQFLKSLIEILGEIRLEDGQVVNAANIDQNLNTFFSFVGDQSNASHPYKNLTSIILNELLKKTFAYGSYNANDLLRKIISLGKSKHVLFFSGNEKLQSLAEKYNLTGTIKSTDGDYLLINDAVFSPKRSSWSISQNVAKTTELKDGQMLTELKIDFEGQPETGSPSNGSNLHFVRVYVPKGSKLIGSEGSAETTGQSEDFEKTVFSAVLILEPAQKKTLVLKYSSPKPKMEDGVYKLLIQKQPGTGDFKYRISLGGNYQEFDLAGDQEIIIKP